MNLVNSSPISQIIFHILLGLIAPFSNIPVIVWGLFVLLSTFFDIVRNNNRNKILHYFFSYLVGFEVFARMANASPFIPYELGKYAIPLFTILVVVVRMKVKSLSRLGSFFVLFSLPSLFYLDFDENFSKGVVFNFFGFLAMVCLIFYFDHERIEFKTELKKMLEIILLPILSTVVFISIKSPDLESFEYNLSALFGTTGGFSSNQVSNILGVGVFISFMYFVFFGSITKIKLFIFKDSILLSVYFLFRGLLTFSRGGMIGGVIPILVFLFFKDSILKWGGNIRISFFSIILIALGLGITIYAVNEISSNNLFLRYSGETAGTISGNKEKDANSVTSGRIEIFENDLILFSMNPILGVGPGKSAIARKNLNLDDQNSHIEVSRMIAEHGIFGVFIALAFVFFPFFKVLSIQRLDIRYIVFTFFFIAVFTSFHSAMRNLITPFFYGLGCANFVFIRETLDTKKNL